MKLKNIHLLILLALCWGPSFLFIKIAVQDIPPFFLAGLRIALGALALNLILLLKRDYLPKSRDFWRKAFIAGFFAVGLPFLLINWGQQYIDSGLGSLLNGLVPIFVIAIPVIFMSERVSENKLYGVLFGFAGLIFLIYPSLRDGVSASTFGIASISLAAVSYAIGLLYIKKHLAGMKSFKAPAAQLLVTSLYMLPIGLILQGDVCWAEVRWEAIGSLIVLGLIGTALAFIIYFRLIDRAGAEYASMVTYLMPVIGVILGAIFLGEVISIWTLMGGGLILLGIYRSSKPARIKEPECCGPQIDSRLYSKFR